MDTTVLKQENTHLKDTLEKVADAKERLNQAMLVMGQANLETLKDLRQNPETSGADFFMFMEMLHEKNMAFNFKEKYKQLDEFESILKEPYFARIDLKDQAGITDTYYVGKFGYTEDKPVITDWRAKVASVYYRYRYPQKNVNYDTPNGVQTRDLTLKRTYEIDKGALIKYFNNDIQLDEKEIITGKISKRTGGVLEDIIETIQESQLDIIESDPRQVCIVQGCVGSGKSTVAIHKLSHIFFNYPSVIHPERSILVAKNQILVGYLSTLFPKLGIFDINYKSLRDLIYTTVFREELGLNVDFDANVDAFKVTINDIQEILAKVDQLHDTYAEKLEEIFSKDEYEPFKSYKYTKNNTIYRNLSDIIEDLEEEVEMEKEFVKESPESTRAYLYKENIKVLKKLIHEIKEQRMRLKETKLNNLCKELHIPVTSKMGYTETLLYLLLYSEIIGLDKMIKFEYCVVDEGQDFSVLEYKVLSKLVLNGRFCILGDLNQSYEEAGLSKWEDIETVVTEAKKAQTFELDTNYRSTKPIIDYANSLLGKYTKSYLPKSIERRGEEPVISHFETQEAMFAALTETLKTETKKLDKSIGIIAFDSTIFENLQTEIARLKLKKDKLITLDKREKISYIPKAVYLSRFEDCKGLEFAKVYVLGLNPDNIKDFAEAKKAFVAVTRAMNELTIYSYGK